MASTSNNVGNSGQSWETMMRSLLATQGGNQAVQAMPLVGNLTTAPAKKTSAADEKKKRREDPNRVQWRDLEENDLLEDRDTGMQYIARRPSVKSLVLEPVDRGKERVAYGRAGSEFYSDESLSSDDFLVIGKYKAKPKLDWSQVILADDKKQAIMDAIRQVDNHELIFEKWGFGEVFEKGTAISVLLYGPPGTGKTLTAQTVADQLGYKLQVIGTAEIESSEPGGAERAIQAFFKEAEKDKKTVLLFDECDSLIADRKAVGMILGAQINCLLSELEKYTGVVFFTTNRLEKLDEAFDRRLSLKLELPMPDAKNREAIWRRMFPKRAPLAKDIDWTALASIEIAGGHIKNVVLRSARAAANSKVKKITQQVLLDCLYEEVASMSAFQEAVKSSNMPRVMGPGITRGTTMSKTMTKTKVGPDGTQ